MMLKMTQNIVRPRDVAPLNNTPQNESFFVLCVFQFWSPCSALCVHDDQRYLVSACTCCSRRLVNARKK